MLVLGRRIHEVLCIGDNIKIRVLRIEGNQVRLGIEAPKDIEVDREEIYNRKRLERGIELKKVSNGHG